MPWKPKRPCNHPGCPNLSDHAYCEVHRKKVVVGASRDYRENRRDVEMQRFYDSPAWRRLRQLKLKQNPMCEECFRQRRISEAVIVDHIVPAKEHPDKRLDIDNLQSLCRSCHNKKTKKNKNGFDF